MKSCISCKIVKPMIFFYRHKEMADGFLNKCKECIRAYSRSKYNENILDCEFKKREKIRGRDKYERLKNNWSSSSNVKRKAMNNYKNKYPEKELAKKACSHLINIDGIEFHHWSYNEDHFKDVIPLEISLHKKIHRYLSYSSKDKKYKTLEGTLLSTKEMHEQYIQAVEKIF